MGGAMLGRGGRGGTEKGETLPCGDVPPCLTVIPSNGYFTMTFDTVEVPSLIVVLTMFMPWRRPELRTPSTP